jgi:hypothetical protein
MLVNPQGMIVASSDSSNLGQSLLTHSANTGGEFELALRVRPGSVLSPAWVVMQNRLSQAAAHEHLSTELLSIQILESVQDSEAPTIGVLVANVLTRQLLWLLQD